MKRLVFSYIVWCMLLGYEVVHGASFKDNERTRVKRDLDIIPAVFSGAVDMTLDLMDRFGKGFAIRGSSKTDMDTLGYHDEKNFETGMGEAMAPNERKKRSPGAGCNKNVTTATNGSNSTTINTRGTNNPDVETLARRKRSPDAPPPNGPPHNGNHQGSPPRGPPNNRTQNSESGNGEQPNDDTTKDQGSSNGNEQNDARRKRSANQQGWNNENQGQNWENQNRNGQRQNMDNENRNLNGYGASGSQNWDNDNRNLNGYGSNQLNGYGASGSQNWDNDNRNLNGYGSNQLNGYGASESQNSNNDNRNPNLNGYGPSQANTGQNLDTRNQNLNGYGRKKRSPKPCNGTGQATNNFPTQQLPQQQQPQQQPRVRRNVQDPDKVLPASSNDETNLFDRIIEVAKEVGRKKRSPKPCNGTGQATNNFPTQQLPQQQQPQQIPPGGVNINDLQRDQQNPRVRRNVQDPDKVLPASSNDEKNLFDRIIEVAKEVVARVTRWANENEKEIAAADTKITPKVPEKPKL